MKTMQRGKIIIAAMAGIFFLATIWGFARGMSGRGLILLILLHSLCLIGLAFAYSAERNDYTGTEELQQELSALRTETEAEKATMQRALDMREKELVNREHDLRRLQEGAEEQEQEIRSLKDAVKAAEAKLQLFPEENEFLPPLTESAPAMIDILKAAEDVVEELKGTARKKEVSLRISSAEESIYVKADPARIRILFRNIIDNSLKYMGRKGSLVITISVVAEDIFIVLKDNGEGLPEDETKHIFELNYQGSNRISGNGLGLTQAKAIVDSYGGTIYAKSTPGNGMGIYIQLPTSRANYKEA